jgi:hypothetical protein
MKEKALKIIKKDAFLIILLIIISFSILFSLSIKLRRNNVYNDDITMLSDRFYSYDDLYYAKRIYANMPSDFYKNIQNTIVKHPLLTFSGLTYGNLKTHYANNIIFVNHYHLIICLQIALTVVSIVYLFIILKDIIKIKKGFAFILSLVYLFANATIISSLLVESFAISAALLIMSYYYISNKNYLIAGIFGSIIMGVTITNAAIWGIMVLFLIGFKDYKNIIKTLVICLLSTAVILTLMNLSNSTFMNYLFKDFFKVIFDNAGSFKANYTILGSIKSAFYYLITSGLFYINTTDMSQIGMYQGEAISFIPKANILLTLLSGILFILITVPPIKVWLKEKDKHILTCLIIIVFNFVLHFGLKFGLYEAFLYTPHFLFTFILLLGILFKYYKKFTKPLLLFTLFIILIQLINNFKAISDIILVVQKAI